MKSFLRDTICARPPFPTTTFVVYRFRTIAILPAQPCWVSILVYIYDIYIYIDRDPALRRLCGDNVFSVVLLLFPRSHVPIYNTCMYVRGAVEAPKPSTLAHSPCYSAPTYRIVYTLIISGYAMIVFSFNRRSILSLCESTSKIPVPNTRCSI